MTLRLLVAYSCNSTFVGTTRRYIESLSRVAGWEAHYVHVTENARMDFDFSGYDALFHNYCARLCFDGYVSPSYVEAARCFRGVKVLSVQDEYDFTDKVRRAAIDIGFDLFLTCVPEESWDYVYPKRLFPDTEFMRVLTGFVPDDLAATRTSWTPLAERPIFIGYRGRDIGGRYGRLGFDKHEIGRRMAEICKARGLAADIGLDEEARIYGDGWFDFLGSCRATLGSESGSNVFDFDGEVAAAFEQAERALGHRPSYAEFEQRIKHLESRIDMGQVSPRIFEAALMKTPLVLFEGRYSGLITPDVHYIPLRRDFSNVDEVLTRLEDLPALERMAERTYSDLVGSGRYSYRAFAERVLAAVERHLPGKPRPTAPPPHAVSNSEDFNRRLAARDSLGETPTREPRTNLLYRAAAAMRTHEAAIAGAEKLAQWASRESAGDAARLAALKDIDARLRQIDAAFLAALGRAHDSADGEAMDAAALEVRRACGPLKADIAEIALGGRSWLAARMAALRAPWVEEDVPQLRWAKTLRERAYSSPAIRRLYAVVKARRSA